MAWEFTPQAQTQVTQVIPPGGTEADYVFGGHHMGVNYFQGFVNKSCDGTNPNDPCLMTVVATPTRASDFHNHRLVGTQFSNEQVRDLLADWRKVHRLLSDVRTKVTQTSSCLAPLLRTAPQSATW